MTESLRLRGSMDTKIRAVTFDEENHKYFFEGRELHGVTGAIGKLLGKSFPDTDTVKLAVIYGHDVHKDSEMWIKEGREPSSESGRWVTQYLKDFKSVVGVRKFEAELLVSDFKSTASCIDIVAHLKDGKAVLFDIKTTSKFDREYCSLQLSCYKRLYEEVYGETVTAMYVLATKSRRAFRILEQDKSKVQKVFDMNKEKA